MAEVTRTGGRPATAGVIQGRYALSVGMPNLPAPSGWRWLPLSKVARLETGHTPSRNKPEYWGGDIPWIGIADATENHGRTISDTYQHTNALGIANSSARLLPANTVCLSRTASVGYVVVMGRPMATSQDFVNWVCSDAIDYRFLKYVLLAENDSMSRFASGTTHQTIYFPEVKAFHICLPPIDEQRAIASTLGTLDDKIELNRRMNETLEALARAIFKSWFVDFDPVHAKAEGRKPFGMDATFALFPNRFGPDGLPDGWREGPPLELARITGGGTPKTTELDYWDGNIAWATAKDVSQCSATFLIKTERSISELGLDNSSAKIVPARSTVVVARGATTGRYCMFGVDLAMNQTCYALRARDGDHYFLFCWFGNLVRRLVHAGHGSVFNTITTGTFETAKALIPASSVRKAFDEKVRSLFEMTLANTNQSGTLASLRDLLLPKLISGEVRASDAERAADGAL
jgi:type I restriction enzyme, S subunit